MKYDIYLGHDEYLPEYLKITILVRLIDVINFPSHCAIMQVHQSLST
jgi:hypothetical protein